MTTALYDRRTKTLAADTQNTDRAGMVYRTGKIERLKDGSYFMGSGNCYTIGLAKRWADTGFDERHRPDFSVMIEDVDEYDFSCLIVSKDGQTVTLVDAEMQPIIVRDNYIAIGSGGAYAIGALDAGVSIERAMAIAELRDGATSGPFDFVTIG